MLCFGTVTHAAHQCVEVLIVEGFGSPCELELNSAALFCGRIWQPMRAANPSTKHVMVHAHADGVLWCIDESARTLVTCMQ